MKNELEEKLEKLAHNRSMAFCYGCYIKCPAGLCPKCFSDDLMRITENNGPEYGYTWIIEEILQEELAPVNVAEEFEETIRECYLEDTNIGWLKVDTAIAIKELDPVSWNIACSEWESSEEQEGNIVSFDLGNTYYRVSEVEDLVEIGQ